MMQVAPYSDIAVTARAAHTLGGALIDRSARTYTWRSALMPATTIPVSFEFSLDFEAGSTATTVRTSGGDCFTRVCSSSARVHSAPGISIENASAAVAGYSRRKSYTLPSSAILKRRHTICSSVRPYCAWNDCSSDVGVKFAGTGRLYSGCQNQGTKIVA